MVRGGTRRPPESPGPRPRASRRPRSDGTDRAHPALGAPRSAPEEARTPLRLVELVAPPGAGKSTLARALLSDRRARSWYDARDLVRPARLAGGVVLARTRTLQRLPRGWRTVLLAAAGEDDVSRALAAVAEDWRDFLAVTARPDADDRSDPRVAALSLLARRWFVEAVGLRALLEGAVADGHHGGSALLDEGLLHPYKVDAGVGPDASARADYLRSVPMPGVVVELRVPDEVLIDRLARLALERPERLRLAVIPASDRSALAAEVRRLQHEVGRSVEAARGRGATIVEVDATMPLPEQVAAILEPSSKPGAGDPITGGAPT